MRNTLFDEKMDGTVHLALGNAYHDLGGTNVSRIHWDIVSDPETAAGSSSTAWWCRRTASGVPETEA